MAEEFRFVVEMSKLEQLNPNLSDVSDFIDYYLARNKRVRHFIKDRKNAGKYFLISSEPGMITKQKKEISKEDAEQIIRKAILIVKKKGAGRIWIEGIEGYSEIVSAFKPGEKKHFLEELHVEFETDQKEIPKLEKSMKPIKIIRVGLFDYLTRDNK